MQDLLVKLHADDEVKIDKGTGLVVNCPYGDWQDVEWIKQFKTVAKPIIA
jgi:valyl-tRNA synthetase